MNHLHTRNSYAKSFDVKARNSRSLGLINPVARKYTIPQLMELGNNFHKTGNVELAESAFRKVLEHQPNHPDALHFLGAIAHQSNDHAAAKFLISKSLEFQPRAKQALNNLGNAMESLGDLEDAIECYEAALEVDPNYEDALFNSGVTLRRMKRYDEAIEALKKCIELNHQKPELQYQIGLTFQECGKKYESQIAYQVALQLDPKYAEVRANLGRLWTDLGRLQQGQEQLEIGLSYDPEDEQLLNCLANNQRSQGKFDDALELLNRAMDVNSTNTETLNNLGSVNQCMGNIEKALDYYLQVIALAPQAEFARKCALFAILNHSNVSSIELYKFHLDLRAIHDKPQYSSKKFPGRSRDPDRKIRLGIVSSDFRTHVVALNVMPLVSNLDRTHFELYLYSEEKNYDKVSELFESHSDKFLKIMTFEDEHVAEMIEQDEIDILITLAGRFDENRPLITTYRPAPIQVSYHDCATSGLDAMDYYLTDKILHPANTTEKFTEELYRLPVYYQYPVQDGLPEIKPLPALTNGMITFGCLNKPEKLNGPVLDLWAEVLNAIPGSRLFLKYFNHYGQLTSQDRWRDKFSATGIDPERVIFAGSLDSRSSHLSIYDNFDIALDPFPFNGATTTFESLSMGVPVITLLGRHFVDRVGASIVNHAGFPEFIAETKGDYVSIAQTLTADLDVLNDLRQTMRNKLHSSSLCDGASHTRDLESAFRDMWKTWCQTGGHKGP